MCHKEKLDPTTDGIGIDVKESFSLTWRRVEGCILMQSLNQ
jgi:hypothetical protein